MEDLFYDLTSFAVDDPTMEGMSLVDTINHVKPNILIGKIEGNTTLFMRYICLYDKFSMCLSGHEAGIYEQTRQTKYSLKKILGYIRLPLWVRSVTVVWLQDILGYFGHGRQELARLI